MKVELIAMSFPLYSNKKNENVPYEYPTEYYPYVNFNSGAIIASGAAKQCYNAGNFDFDKFITSTPDHKLAYKVAQSGHLSILEHASATFLISGVSRALSHQLVRHRLASYTQQSQRYTNMETAEYVVPDTIKKYGLENTYKHYVDTIFSKYAGLVNKMVEQGCPKQKALEDARYILPNACTTQLVMTMNYRELGDFLGKRMCNRAQWEIRKLAGMIFDIMSEREPILFNKETGIFRGSKCQNLGYCDEKRSCGYMKPKEETKEEENNISEEELNEFVEDFANSLLRKMFNRSGCSRMDKY